MSGGDQRSVGTRFTTTAGGYLYGVRYWHTAADTLARNVTLWRNGNYETTWAVSSPIGGTARWVDSWFGAAYPLENGNTYTVSMDAREGWVIQCCTTPTTISGLSTVGSYYGTVGAMPNNAQDTTGATPDEGWALVDVLYGQVQQAFSTATVQAANTATAGAAATATAGAGSAYTIRAGTTASVGGNTGQYSLGMRFYLDNARVVTAVRFYKPSGMGNGMGAGLRPCALFADGNSTALANGVFANEPSGTGGGNSWHDCVLSGGGVSATASAYYRAAYLVKGDDFGYINPFPGGGYTSGNGEAHAVSGWYYDNGPQNTAVVYPDSGGSDYLVDVVVQGAGSATATPNATGTAGANATATANVQATATANAVTVGAYATQTAVSGTATAAAGAIQTVYAGQISALQTQAAGAASAQQTTLANAIGTVHALQTTLAQATATLIPTPTPLPGYLYLDPAQAGAFATQAAAQATIAAWATVDPGSVGYEATQAAAQATIAQVQAQAGYAAATVYAFETQQAQYTATTTATPLPFQATMAAAQSTQAAAQPTSQGILAGIQAAIEAIPNGIGTAVAGPLQPLATAVGQWQVQATATAEPGGAVVILRQTVEPVWSTKTAWIVDAEATVTGIGTSFTTAAAGKSDCASVPNLTTTLHLPGGSFSVTLVPGWAMGIICVWRPVMAAIIVCFSTFFWIKAGMRQWANLVE